MSHDPKTERDPEEVELLARAHGLFQPLMLELALSAKPFAEYTDEEAKTAAFGIIGAEWLAGRRFSLDRPQKCGWCIEAAGNDAAAFDMCPYFDNTAAVRAHTVVCEHNPLVAELAQAQALAMPTPSGHLSPNLTRLGSKIIEQAQEIKTLAAERDALTKELGRVEGCMGEILKAIERRVGPLDRGVANLVADALRTEVLNINRPEILAITSKSGEPANG